MNGTGTSRPIVKPNELHVITPVFESPLHQPDVMHLAHIARLLFRGPLFQRVEHLEFQFVAEHVVGDADRRQLKAFSDPQNPLKGFPK
jgi:hypothetical protein